MWDSGYNTLVGLFLELKMIKNFAFACASLALASAATASDNQQAYDKNEALSPAIIAMIKASYDPIVVAEAK